MIEANGYEVFCPIVHSYDSSLCIEPQRNKMLLPSLLFVRCDDNFVESGYHKQRIEALPVINTENGKPIRIPEIQIQSLKMAVDADFRDFEKLESQEIGGPHVRVKEGSLKGSEGYIVKLRTNKRFVVKVNGIGAFATIYLPPYALESIDRWYLVKLKRNANVKELYEIFVQEKLSAFMPVVWDGSKDVCVFGNDFVLVRCDEDKLNELKSFFTVKNTQVIDDVTARNLWLLMHTNKYPTCVIDEAEIDQTLTKYYVGDKHELTGLKVYKALDSNKLYVPIEQIGKTLVVCGVEPECLVLQDDGENEGKQIKHP